MSVEPRGPTTEELRARVLAQSSYDTAIVPGNLKSERAPIRGDTPAAILLSRPCLACNRETGERMCDLCTRLEIAEARAKP